MASPGTILIATFDTARSAAERLVADLAAAWPASDVPEFRIIEPTPTSSSDDERPAAVVIIADGAAHAVGATQCLASMVRQHVPVLGLVPTPGASSCPFGAASVPALPLDADASVIAPLLHGMMGRQGEVDELCRDLDMMQRYQGGLGMEMAKLLEELQLAAMVQREFLPEELPTVCGVSFGVLWRPANYVSGDTFDVMKLDDDHVGVFLADAVGHGVPAALMTMMIHQSLRTAERATKRLLRPSEVLKRLNTEMIRRHSGTSRFATGVYALINCRERTITLAGAGHPPPLLLRADDDIVEIDTPGSLLGIFPDEEFEDVTHELHVNDRVLFYTDGFEQAFPHETKERKIPTTRYLDEFSRLRESDSAAGMIEELSHRVDQQRGSLHQLDDLTLICVHAGSLTSASETSAPAGVVSA